MNMKNQKNNTLTDKDIDTKNMKKGKLHKTVIDKVLFIFLSIAATLVFIWDVVKDFIPETMWQLKLLIMIIGALSGFFSLLSFLWDKKFTNSSEKIKDDMGVQSKKIKEDMGAQSDKIKEDMGVQLEKEINKIIETIQKCKLDIQKPVELVSHLAAILSSNENRRISFARRRLVELDSSLQYVANEHASEKLSVSTYYSELNYLNDQLKSYDKPENCVIWAMTGFSDTEWDDAGNDLETDWCNTLVNLTKRIPTKRICIVHNNLLDNLKKEKDFYSDQKKDWDDNKSTVEKIKNKSFKSFIDYLKTYYSEDKSQYKIKSICVKSSSQKYKDLVEAKGYFGIKLSDNQKFLIKGEAVDVRTGLQGQFVFSDDIINKLFILHESAFEIEADELTAFIKNTASISFKEFCKEQGIQLD